MSTGFFNALLEFVKLAPRYLVSLGVACAFLIFGPQGWLKYLGIHELAQQYRPKLAIFFILITALFGVDRAIAIFRWIRNRMLRSKRSESRLQRLHGLTEYEKQILRFYIGNQTKTNYLQFEDGIIQGLVSAGIIYQASSLGNLVDGFAYNITEFAWEYLNKNIYLLHGRTNIMRTDKRQSYF